MLVAKARIADRQLEPTDNSSVVVTVHNTNPAATAQAVKVSASLEGGPLPGIKLTPQEQEFGTIPPLGQAKREFNLNTERAEQRKYQIKFNLMYDSSVPTHECDQEEFVVVPD
jgi:hypothetical protein